MKVRGARNKRRELTKRNIKAITEGINVMINSFKSIGAESERVANTFMKAFEGL